MDMKRFFLYAIAIAALALAGCGGGNGGMPPAGPGGGDPPPPMTHDIDLGELLMGFMDVPAGDYEIAAGGSMNVGDATIQPCPAGGMGCSVTVAEDGTATSTGGAATASPSPAAMVAYEKKKAEDKKAAEDAKKAALAKGMGIAMALESPTPAAAGNGLPVGVTVTRATTGAPKIALTVTDDGATTDDDADDGDRFAAADDITMSVPPAITGWMGQTQTRSGKETTDMVTTYTNIKNATPKNLEATSTDSGLTLGEQGHTAVLNDDKRNFDEDAAFAGSFRGHAGSFTCTEADGCTVNFVPSANLQTGQDPNTVAYNHRCVEIQVR